MILRWILHSLRTTIIIIKTIIIIIIIIIINAKIIKQIMVRIIMIKHIRKRLSEYIQLHLRILLNEFKN